MVITIVGYGEMARALIEGLLQSGEEVEVIGRSEEKLQQIALLYPIQTRLLDGVDIQDKTLILAVKPHTLEEVAKKLQGEAALLISILAGVELDRLHIIKAHHYVRAMPNIAAAKKASMTTLTGDIEAKPKALEIFSHIGRTLWVESEKELDIATAIAGSGPAFLALVAEAIADGGVAAGLKREDAFTLTKGLFHSFSSLEDEHPALIKDKVMSPAGTTAAGYRALESEGVRSAFIEAILEAYQRTLKTN
ncbi:MAG: pyrroline-5-carboxylate reductase [Epsilonproteobacteria bacterium]|nr:pyrroline-5-carboxylate reductase [Campylobacterota bacterium]NPA63814.1 pyrroline-5-carboxylate reductase [Campylobacterota bacterium]